MASVTNEQAGFLTNMRNPEYRQKFIYSLVMFMAFAFLGMRNSQHGPAFLDLAQITNSNIEQASAFYTALFLGSLLGTFLMGFLYDRLTNHSHLLLGTIMILATVSTAAIPWSSNFMLTVALFFIGYVFIAAFDMGGNADWMRIWGKEGKMFTQFMHFCYSSGTIISPLTVEPFLSHRVDQNGTECQNKDILRDYEHRQNLTNFVTTEYPLNVSVNISSEHEQCTMSESRIQYAYLIVGVLCFVAGVAIIVEGILNKKTRSNRKEADDKENSQKELPRWLMAILLVLVGALFFFHMGSVTILVSYAMAFVVNKLGWEKDEGTKLLSVFCAVYALFRLVGVVVAKFLTPGQMLLLSDVIVLLTTCGLWISADLESYWGFWICLVLSASGFASIFPTGIIFLENRITRVTGRVASVIWIGVNIQGIVNPLLVGYLMEQVSAMWYVYLIFSEAVLCLVSYLLLELILKLFVSKYRRELTIEVEADESKDKFITEKIV